MAEPTVADLDAGRLTEREFEALDRKLRGGTDFEDESILAAAVERNRKKEA
jgi:hypothetical protein